jgi:uncharacterized hydrophobic protein (TIGR00271 family)
MLIASIGVLVDQPILIVGAMVVGPEFGPLVALCVGIVARQPRRAGTALGALLLGILVGMMGTVLFTWAMTAIGLVDESMLTGERPLTSFIWQPDALSWIVGFLAGVAGLLVDFSQVRRSCRRAHLGDYRARGRQRRCCWPIGCRVRRLDRRSSC